MRFILTFLCALVLALPSAKPASANPLVDGASDWKGDGIFRRAIGSAAEGMRCRGQSQPTAKGFTLTGRCASAVQSATLDLTADLSNGRARLTLKTSLLERTLTLSGTSTDEGLAAKAASPVVIDDRSAEFRLQINYDGPDGFLLTEFVTPTDGGPRTELVQIQFSR